jgi:hypothetical protein
MLNFRGSLDYQANARFCPQAGLTAIPVKVGHLPTTPPCRMGYRPICSASLQLKRNMTL